MLAGYAPLSRADGDYGTAKLVISNRPGEHAAGLTWKTFDVPVRVESSNGERRAFADLSGAIDRTDANIVHNDQGVALTPNPEGNGASFTLPVILTGKITPITLFAVDPYGQAQPEKAVLVFPNWTKFNLPVTAQQKNNKRFLWSFGIGLSYENYNESGTVQLTEYAITPKVNLVYLLKPHEWELGANTFINAFPVNYTTNPAGLTYAHWWGINGRVGYRLPIDSVPATNFWVMTGWYVWGMIVSAPSDQTYGVTYLGGPQLFLTARITPAGKRAMWVYAKYATIDSSVGVFSSTNREIAGGGGFEISERGAKHPVSLTLDIADAKYSGFQTDPNGNPIPVSFSLFSTTLGVSVGL